MGGSLGSPICVNICILLHVHVTVLVYMSETRIISCLYHSTTSQKVATQRREYEKLSEDVA